MNEKSHLRLHSTTVVGLRHNGHLALAADGQVTIGQAIMKQEARKLRRLHDGTVLVGFAGASADALTLFEKLESKLKEYNGNLARAAVELAKDWRSDRILRRLEALLVAGDVKSLLLISGSGDVLEPDDQVAAIGSGGGYALAAARAFKQAGASMSAHDIAEASLRIASGICVYTNDRITVETLGEE